MNAINVPSIIDALFPEGLGQVFVPTLLRTRILSLVSALTKRKKNDGWNETGYRIPESLRVFWSIVSFTAANPSRMIVVVGGVGDRQGGVDKHDVLRMPR